MVGAPSRQGQPIKAGRKGLHLDSRSQTFASNETLPLLLSTWCPQLFFGSNLNEVLQVWTKNKRFRIMTTVKFSILQKMIFSRLQPFCVYCHRHNKQTSFSFPFSKLPFRRATLSLATYQSSFSRSQPIRARREFYRPIKSLVSSSIPGGGVGSWRRGGTEAVEGLERG